jgi:hypothetical protein
MAIADYQQLIDDVIEPEITETVFTKMLDDLRAALTEDTSRLGGSKIARKVRTSITSNARNYDRTDVDPEAGTFEAVQAEWDKTYQETAAEVHEIDISEAENGGIDSISDLIQDAIALEMGQLEQLIWNNLYTRLRADIDDTNAYSDASLSRSTYPTLASTVDTTDTAITIALMRSLSNTARLNKNSGPKSGFLWMMESQVYDVFEPLAAALHTWNITGEANKPIDAGYQVIGNFEGTPLISPPGMTTGDVFLLRKRDCYWRNHRKLTIKQVPSGRDSAKFIIRTGVTGWNDNPGFLAKMTNKD